MWYFTVLDPDQHNDYVTKKKLNFAFNIQYNISMVLFIRNRSYFAYKFVSFKYNAEC